MPFISIPQLTEFGERIFVAAGVAPAIARRVMQGLVRANTYGIHSHGVVRLADYVNHVKSGRIKVDALPVVVKENAVTALLDGQWGFGQVVAERAMQLAIEKARANGAGIVCAMNSNHIGAIGEYTEMAANAGMIGLAIVNGIGKLVAPHGGRARMLSTNPIAFSVPVPGGRPLLMDFATSAVAEGKIKVARNKGAKVPRGWILDKEGASSDDPEDFYAGGFLLPVGAHKGYGLSIMVEILAGLLSGAGAALLDTPPSNGCFFLALSPDFFRPSEAFLADVRRLVDALRSTPPLDDAEPVLVPGDPETKAEARHRREGIELDAVTWQTIVDAGRSVGVEFGGLSLSQGGGSSMSQGA
ncbi:MAG: Ldh family oxidoreductase [Chloroflexi bacterium]|nr:Ldh family oxidoreductase [Chloroflexota bacterium]